MALSVSVIFVFCVSIPAFSYNIQWGDEYTYYDGGSRNPYTLHVRGTESSNLVICFEETQDVKFSGLCEGASLNLVTESITFGPKAIFQLENASNPYEMQIYGSEGWTNFFLIAYTNGPNAAEGQGKVLMGHLLPDGRIAYSPNQFTFNPYLNDQSQLIELQNNSYFIVCASVGDRNQYDTACKIGKYDTEGMTIGLGTRAFNMSLNHQTHGMAVARINQNTFLSCFGQFITRRGVCFVGTVVGNFTLNSDIKFGNAILFDADGGIDNVKIIHLSSTVLVICYKKFDDGECRLAQVAQITGSTEYTIIISSERFVFQSNAIDSPTIFRVPPNSLLPNSNNPELLGVCYVDENNGVCKFAEVDLNTMKLNFDTDFTNAFADRGVGTINSIYLYETTNKIVVCYVKFAGSTPLFNRGLCKYGTITVD